MKVLNRRNKKGQAIIEFGPTLFILLLMIFFPLMDLLSMGFSYACCVFLNSCQAKQAALLPSAQVQDSGGTVKKSLVQTWMTGGMGQYVKVVGQPTTTITYRPGQTDPNTHIADQYVRVTTAIKISPFVAVPIPPLIHLPGLNEPMTFTISTEAQEEDPDNAS